MKFSCKVGIVPVDISRTGHSAPKPCYSTVALGHHGPEKGGRGSSGNTSGQPLYLKICSDKNKLGTRYKVTSNIKQMFHRFAMSQGRATVSLHHPKLDIHFSEAKPNELCQLLTVLRMPADKQLTWENVTSLADLSVTKKAVKKLVITKTGDYRSSLLKLPDTLEQFEASSLGVVEIDVRVLRLSSLRSINVSNNSLSQLPERAAWPSNLTQLDVSHNKITVISLEFCNSSLSTSLVNLNLSNNPIERLPELLCEFKSLAVLDVNQCSLVKLPFTLGCLKQLQHLDVSHNRLRYLPKSLMNLHLSELKVAGILFDPVMISRRNWPPESTWTVPTLMDLAATVIVQNRIPHEGLLPPIMTMYMRSALTCECGRPVFLNGLECMTTQPLHGIATKAQYNPDRDREPVETAACSRRCLERFRHKLFPLPQV